MQAEDMGLLGEKPRTALHVTQQAAWVLCLYHFTLTLTRYECDVEDSGRRCTHIRGSWAQRRSLELRGPEFFIENRKPIWLLLQRRHELYYSGKKTRLPFVPDTISVFRVCLLWEHAWRDSLEQRQSVVLLVGHGEMEMTQGELSPERSTKDWKQNRWLLNQ